MGKKKLKPEMKAQKKEARTALQAPHITGSNASHNPVWQLQHMDFEHSKWGWSNIHRNTLNEIFIKLKEYESRTWGEININKKRDHPIGVHAIIKEARDRLGELKLDDHDSLYRLRLSGEQRVWGILENYIFKILWWDPEHVICPSTKKHT